MNEADEREAAAAQLINSQLQHTDAITVLAMALERHTRALDSHREEMHLHTEALNSFDPPS